ncbi:MAG: transporter [Planctomycetota bacterium]
MNKRRVNTISIILLCLWAGQEARGTGISVDAGLTPPEDRWIVRTQLRYMTRKHDRTPMDRKMSMYTFPVVVAHGVTSDFTLMMRQAVRHRDMDMMGDNDKDTGLDDLFLMGKYELIRKNTPSYIFGTAATLGLEFPTGADDFTSDTLDIMPGIYTSWRKDAWSADFQVAYKWNGFADRGYDGLNPGNELKLDCAFSYQFSLTEDSSTTIAPVLEFSYRNVAPDRRHDRNLSDTGENVFYVSPGVKYTQETFKIEALLQIPIWQDQKGDLLERGVGLIIGSRFLF